MSEQMVFKFLISEEAATNMPKGATILTAQFQDHVGICVWALCDPYADLEPRRFAIVGTGRHMPDGPHQYIATTQAGALVWHVFELGEP